MGSQNGVDNGQGPPSRARVLGVCLAGAAGALQQALAIRRNTRTLESAEGARGLNPGLGDSGTRGRLVNRMSESATKM